MIHEQTAFAIADPIDDGHPLVLPSLRIRNPAGVELAQGGEGTAAGLSGSVPAAAPHSDLPRAAMSSPPGGGAGESALPPGPPFEAAGHIYAGVPRAQAAEGGSPIGRAAMEAIMAERIRQIVKFGHTPEKDLGKKPRALLAEIQRCLSYAIEDAQFHKPDWREDCRRHVVQVGACALAMIDFLDAGGGQ